MYGVAQMYRAYIHRGNVLGAYRCTNGHTDVWGEHMYGGVYRCNGHTDIWGMYLEYTDVLGMYWGHIDVQIAIEMYGAYRHMGDVLGEYRCRGNVQGHTDVWRDIQMYGWCTDVRACTDVGVIQTPSRHTDSQTPLYMPANYIWVLYFS